MFTFRGLFCRLLFGAVAFTMSARADTIYFTHGVKIARCKVIEINGDRVVVTLEKGGRAVISQNILKIEYDYDSRRAALAADDFPGLYELGVRCEELSADNPRTVDQAFDFFSCPFREKPFFTMGKNDVEIYEQEKIIKEAINLYSRTRGKNGVPDIVYCQLAKLLSDGRTPPDYPFAIENYRAYLALHPDDQGVKDAIAAIERRGNLTPSLAAAETTTETIIDDDLLEGMEETKSWQNETWSNPGTTRLVKDQTNSGNQILEFTINPGEYYDKAVFRTDINRDLTHYDLMTFDAYNPQKFPVSLWAAMVSGDDYLWYEQLPIITLPPEKWTRNLQIDFTRNYWKAFKGENLTGNNIAPQLNLVRSLSFVFGEKQETYKVYLDAINFGKHSAPAE